MDIFSVSNSFITSFFAPIVSPFVFTTFDQPVLFYVDSGDHVTVEVFIGENAFAGESTSQFVTLTGYEVDCVVATCAPIATQ